MALAAGGGWLCPRAIAGSPGPRGSYRSAPLSAARTAGAGRTRGVGRVPHLGGVPQGTRLALRGGGRYAIAGQNGRAHVCNPVTNAQILCRVLPEHKNNTNI